MDKVESRERTDAAVVVTSFEGNCTPSSAADDGITEAEVIPSPLLSAVNNLSTESAKDDRGVPLAAVSTGTSSEEQQSALVSLSSNQNVAQPVVPDRLSTVSTSDDLETFLRQLSHVSSKSDADDNAVDILTEFDEVISQLDTSSPDVDSQKTLIPKDEVASDFGENLPPQAELTSSAVENSDSTMIVADFDNIDNTQSSDDTVHIKAQDEKMLDSAAGDDKDDDRHDSDDDVLRFSQSSALSLLLQCKYEPPYLPTVGMYTSTPAY